VWEAAGYPWSVRRKAMLPAWMPWIRKRFGMGREMEREFLAISPRQMERRLRLVTTDGSSGSRAALGKVSTRCSTMRGVAIAYAAVIGSRKLLICQGFSTCR